MRNLYKLTTSDNGEFWVIADDPTTAEQSLEYIQKAKDHGFRNGQRVVNIELITSNMMNPSSINGCHINNESRLLIVKDKKYLNSKGDLKDVEKKS